jgi:hypothetical protein
MIIYEPGRWSLDVLGLFHNRMSREEGEDEEQG